MVQEPEEGPSARPEERRDLFFNLQRMTGAILDPMALDRGLHSKVLLTCNRKGFGSCKHTLSMGCEEEKGGKEVHYKLQRMQQEHLGFALFSLLYFAFLLMACSRLGRESFMVHLQGHCGLR